MIVKTTSDSAAKSAVDWVAMSVQVHTEVWILVLLLIDPGLKSSPTLLFFGVNEDKI